MEKTVLFQGSRERLKRMVARYGGTFPQEREFTLLWQSEQYKKLHRKTFRICCRFEKEETGYRLTYRIRPAAGSRLRTALVSAVWILAGIWAWDPAEPAGTVAALVLASVDLLTNYWQKRDCEKEFLRRFTAVTK